MDLGMFERMTLGELIRYAEWGQSSVSAQMQAQQAAHFNQNLYGLTSLYAPAWWPNQSQVKYRRRLSDEQLDERFKQLTIDLEARRS